jgi:AraC-like DNA-binding protein
MPGKFMHKLDSRRFGSFTTAIGTLTRLACARVQAAGIKPEPLLTEAGLTLEQIRDRSARLSVRHQIRFLNIAAAALQDELLGFHLAEAEDIRELGLLYYVPASSQALGEGLRRAARYTSMVNESLSIEYREDKHVRLIFDYVGVPRHSDRHQIEACLTILIRLCRHLTRRHLIPARVRIAHRGDPAISKLAAFVGTEIEFSARFDEVAFASDVKDVPVVGADPYLNELLIAYAEEAMARHSTTRGSFLPKVENAMASLLPHGMAGVGEISRQLGMGQRTLARRLASEGLTFSELLETLRGQLAQKYLSDPGVSISEIAWLLGYQEVSGFSHAFKRWTGKTPREARVRRPAARELGRIGA